MSPSDGATGEAFGGLDRLGEGMTVVGIARQRFGVQHELPARRPRIGGYDRGLHTELVLRVCLALADALDLGRVEGIELPAALALLLGANLIGARERPLECRFELTRLGGAAFRQL